jgi:catechol 2,3-dioxygenase
LIAAEIPLEGASDHGVSEALYLRDPDDNGVELYWDRPREQWRCLPRRSISSHCLKEPELAPQAAVVER